MTLRGSSHTGTPEFSTATATASLEKTFFLALVIKTYYIQMPFMTKTGSHVLAIEFVNFIIRLDLL